MAAACSIGFPDGEKEARQKRENKKCSIINYLANKIRAIGPFPPGPPVSLIFIREIKALAQRPTPNNSLKSLSFSQLWSKKSRTDE
jgi:hypothetical protein